MKEFMSAQRRQAEFHNKSVNLYVYNKVIICYIDEIFIVCCKISLNEEKIIIKKKKPRALFFIIYTMIFYAKMENWYNNVLTCKLIC